MIVINRRYAPKYTAGDLTATFNGQTLHLKTIELPWKDNKRRISCIPEGTYRVISHKSPRFGNTFWLQDVPGRSEILIHVGNFTRDLLGCIAPGMAHADIDGDGIMDVTQSRVAMNKLLALLWPKEFQLTITSASGPPSLS